MKNIVATVLILCSGCGVVAHMAPDSAFAKNRAAEREEKLARVAYCREYPGDIRCPQPRPGMFRVALAAGAGAYIGARAGSK